MGRIGIRRIKAGGKRQEKRYNFELISRYFFNLIARRSYFHIISENTCNDLDLNDVFIRIDRTRSCIGQQYLYSRLRIVGEREELAAFDRLVGLFPEDEALSGRVGKRLEKLSHRDGYFFEELFHGVQLPVKKVWPYYVLAAMFVASFVGAFFSPLFVFVAAAIFITNMVLHYKNKSNLQYYTTGVSELSKTLKAAQAIACEPKIRDYYGGRLSFLESIAGIKRKADVMSFSQPLADNDLLSIAFLITEFIKIPFNFELIVFYSFIGDLLSKKEDLHRLFRFIGETDSALTVAELRSEAGVTCTPEFSDRKMFDVKNMIHPLIENCIPNSISLLDRSVLLTGSNMSGKTTFIRSVAINSLLAQTIFTCFAEHYRAPFVKLFTSIRITDDLSEGASYYLEEVLTIRRFVEESPDEECLFVLDEIFKGTNTVERIAIARSVLSFLNSGRHIVFVSTHDIELTRLLGARTYELYHFSEKVDENELKFDYILHHGELKTYNAIRILELYGYPREIIDQARRTKESIEVK